MFCTSCGKSLPEPRPAFCPHCGAAQAELTPATASVTATTSAPQRFTKKMWIGLALMVAGALMWDHGPLSALYSAFPFLAGVALSLVLHFKVELLRGTPLAQRNALGIAAALLVVPGFLRIGFSIGTLPFLIGAFLYAYEVRNMGRLGEFDPELPRRSGWPRRIMAVCLLLAAFIIGADWTGSFYSSYVSTSGYYEYTHTSSMDAMNAYDSGYGHWLALLLTPALLWVFWKPAIKPNWYPWVPIASIGSAAALAVKALIDDLRHVNELHDIGDSYPQFQASGPTWFVILLIPALTVSVIAIFLGRERKHP